MAGYFEIPEGDIIAGYVALAEDIIDIEENVGNAISQSIIDNEGEAFVLDGDEDAFKLTPVTTTVDQTNQNGDDWKHLQDIYVKQTITPTASSIRNVYLRLKNTSAYTIPTSFKLKLPDTEDEDGEVLATYSMDVDAGLNTTCAIPFNVDHLESQDYEIVIDRTNTTGLYVLYDDAGTYNKSMKESVDGVNFNALNYDLWFWTEYANKYSLDIVGSIAVVGGEKAYNLDTHVIIGDPSSYGDRIDIVTMNGNGIFEVIEGTVAAKPTAPTVTSKNLKIAEIYIPINAESSSFFTISQDDTSGVYRLRSMQERVRRLEKKLEWVNTYNSPKRIKYNLTGTDFFDATNSVNMAYDSSLGAYSLSSSASIVSKLDLTSDSGLNTIQCTNVDHSIHTDLVNNIYGKITLAKSTTSSVSEGAWRDASAPLTTTTLDTWANNKTLSYYMGIYSSCSVPGYLNKFVIDIKGISNVKRAKCVCFLHNGSSYAGEKNRPTFVEESSYLNFNNGIPQNPDSTRPKNELTFTFSNTKWLKKDTYLFVIFVEPIKKTSPAKITYQMWSKNPKKEVGQDTVDKFWYRNGTTYYPVEHDDVVRFWGWYPMKKMVVLNQHIRYGIAFHTLYNKKHITHEVVTTKNGYKSSGIITASPTATTYGIANVSVDPNITLPSGTYYKIEVSNDGGGTFYPMSTNSYTFSSQVGTSFVWRMTLFTNDTAITPVLEYDPDDEYAIKFTLGLVSGSTTSGSLVTKAFDGVQIAEDALEMGIDKFSHWEWLRTFCTGPKNITEESEQFRSLTIDLEASEDNSVWVQVKEGLHLDDLYHGSIDYSNYEGSYEIDEYNYYCDVDEDIIADTTLVESCESLWNSASVTGVTVTLENGSTHIKQGTYSNKIAIADAATAGQAIALKTVSLDLSSFKQISFWIQSDQDLAPGDFQFIVGTNSTGTTGEFHNVPAIADGGTGVAGPLTRVVFDLDDPSLLTSVQSFGIKMVTDKVVNLWIDKVEAMKTLKLPFYQRYVRFRFNVKRDNAGVTSPSIRKVGTVEILT